MPNGVSYSPFKICSIAKFCHSVILSFCQTRFASFKAWFPDKKRVSNSLYLESLINENLTLSHIFQKDLETDKVRNSSVL